jgi:hypothetical protein
MYDGFKVIVKPCLYTWSFDLMLIFVTYFARIPVTENHGFKIHENDIYFLDYVASKEGFFPLWGHIKLYVMLLLIWAPHTVWGIFK